jgi:uncharacterized protein DUF4266
VRRLPFLAALAAFVLLSGCARVQPWERGRLASAPMQLKPGTAERFEQNAETYREGAAGANGGKSGGGCGCS